jgi:hypothetical protein
MALFISQDFNSSHVGIVQNSELKFYEVTSNGIMFPTNISVTVGHNVSYKFDPCYANLISFDINLWQMRLFLQNYIAQTQKQISRLIKFIP